MGRTPGFSCATVALIVFGFSGCRESVEATLTVHEPLDFVSSGVRRLPPGRYPIRVSVDDGRTVTLTIEERRGKTFSARIMTRTRQTGTSPARISSTESGQPFDIAYTLQSYMEDVPVSSSQSYCQYDTVDTQCRTVVETDSLGHTMSREVCDTVRVARSGTRTSATVRETSTDSLSGKITDPASGREVATLTAFNQRFRTRAFLTPCQPVR